MSRDVAGTPAWTRSAPAHWERMRLKWTVSGCQNGVWGEKPQGDEGLICVRVADFDRVKNTVELADPTFRSIPGNQRRGRMLRPGDLLLEKSGGGTTQPVGVVVRFDHHVPAVCSNFIARMPVRSGFDSRFLCYLHAFLYDRRINTRSIKQTTGIQNLDSSSYLSEIVAIPPLEEQRAIADVLDAKLSHLDQSLVTVDRQIICLGQYHTSLITEALTSGGGVGRFHEDPHASLPDDWSVVRLRYLITKPLSYGVLKPARSDADDAVPLVRTCDVTERGGVLRDQLIAIPPEQATEYRRTRLEKGDVVVSVVGTIGRSFVVGDDLEGANLSRALARIATSDRVLSAWVDAYVRSDLFKARADLIAAGTAQKVLNMGDLSDFPLPVPPVAEQYRILEELNSSLAMVDDAKGDLEEQRADLMELRQALISAGVCGRLNTQPRLLT